MKSTRESEDKNAKASKTAKRNKKKVSRKKCNKNSADLASHIQKQQKQAQHRRINFVSGNEQNEKKILFVK